MSAKYTLFYKNPSRGLEGVLKCYDGLNIAVVEKTVGALSVQVPLNFSALKLLPDAIIEVQRETASKKYLFGETCYYLRDWTLGYDGRMRPYLILECDDSMVLGERRIVDYQVGTAQAEKTMALDNMMKEIISENYTVWATDSTRRLASTVLSLEGNKTAAPSGTKSFGHKNVNSALVEIADQSEQLGTYLTWGWVWTGTQLDFRTYTRARGTDLGVSSGAPLWVSLEKKNLISPKLHYIYRGTASHIIAGGQGDGVDRVIQRAQSAALANVSAIGRTELFVDARNAELATAVLAEANAELAKRRPKVHFSGKLRETKDCRLDEDFQFGSIVAVDFMGMQFDCRISSIEIKVSESGNEELEIPLEGESFLL